MKYPKEISEMILKQTKDRSTDSVVAINNLQEVIISASIIFVFNTFKRMAQLGSNVDSLSFEKALLNFTQPFSLNVRMNIISQYLRWAVDQFLNHYLPNKKLNNDMSKIIDETIRHYNNLNGIIETGWAKAMRFSLFPEERENGWDLFENLRQELINKKSTSPKFELNRFCTMAESLGRQGEFVSTLMEINSNLK